MRKTQCHLIREEETTKGKAGAADAHLPPRRAAHRARRSRSAPFSGLLPAHTSTLGGTRNESRMRCSLSPDLRHCRELHLTDSMYKRLPVWQGVGWGRGGAVMRCWNQHASEQTWALAQEAVQAQAGTRQVRRRGCGSSQPARTHPWQRRTPGGGGSARKHSKAARRA